MRVTHTLIETPTSRKTNTLWRVRHTQTLRERNIHTDSETQTPTLRDTVGVTQRHTHRDTHSERDTHTHTESYPCTLRDRDKHNSLKTHTH